MSPRWYLTNFRWSERIPFIILRAYPLGLWIITSFMLARDQLTTHNPSSRGPNVLVRLERKGIYINEAKLAWPNISSNWMSYLCYTVSLLGSGDTPVLKVFVLSLFPYQNIDVVGQQGSKDEEKKTKTWGWRNTGSLRMCRENYISTTALYETQIKRMNMIIWQNYFCRKKKFRKKFQQTIEEKKHC